MWLRKFFRHIFIHPPPSPCAVIFNFLLSSLFEITGTGNIYFIPFLTDATFCLIYSANDAFPWSKHQTYEKGK